MRNIKIISTELGLPKTIQSSSTTWGELKRELSRELSHVEDMKATLKEGRLTLEMNDSVIPDTDVTILLTPKSIKAGATVDMTSIMEALKEKFSNIIDEIIEEIEDGEHDDNNTQEDLEDAEDMRLLREIQRQG